MYGEPDEDYLQEEDSEEIPTEMWQESSWITISAFFEEKGKTFVSYIMAAFPANNKTCHFLMVYTAGVNWNYDL